MNNGYNEVIDSKEFEALLKEQKYSLKDSRKKNKKHSMQSSKHWMNPYLRKS